jgi:NADH dehydrogenase
LFENGGAAPYDTLVLATGARPSYFGHPEWEPHAPGLKSFEDATEIRRRILLAFEEADLESDAGRRQALHTFVVVGGGPTGVELAGAIADLARDTLAPDFRASDPGQARVILIEAGPRLLPGYPADLSDYTKRALEQLGAEVYLGAAVSHIDNASVHFGDRQIAARTVIWAAGVRASPAADWLGFASDKAGRIIINDDLTVPGHPDIFAIGDTANMTMPDGTAVPGIAPAAKQAGRYVARVIRARLREDKKPPPFKYHHQGSLAQIGKRRAVIDFGWIKLRGALAWWIWGIAHIYFLIGVRTRLAVALDWLWISLRNQRSARLISKPPAGMMSEKAAAARFKPQDAPAATPRP